MATKYDPTSDAATYCHHNGHYCPGCPCKCHTDPQATISAFRTLWKNGVRVELSCGHAIMLATEANLSIGQRWNCPDCYIVRSG